MAVPKLGELRRLPPSEESPRDTIPRNNESSVGAGIVFAVLGLIAIASLLAAGYSGIRWATVKTSSTTEELPENNEERPENTEEHLELMREILDKSPPASMIREFEDMEKFSLDITAPYGYKRMENEKTKWGRATLVSGLIGLVCVIGAIAAGASAGNKRESV